MKLMGLVLGLLQMWGCAHATTQPVRMAQLPGEAHEWLSLVDSGLVDQAWDSSSDDFRACGTSADLEQLLVERRDAFGDLRSRELRSIKGKKRVEGLPELKGGRYLELLYDASFTTIPSATETLVLVPNADGSYRVGRYCIRGKRKEAAVGAQKP